jgi:hypothetical protein
MSDSTLSIETVFEEIGLAAKYEIWGEARGEKKARNLLNLGRIIEQTAQTFRLPIEKIQAIYAAMYTNRG